jgi:hypothetical protein
MKKLLIALLLLSVPALAADNFLSYQFNENVIIRISNIPCKIKDVDNKKYPFTVLALRIDKQVLPGCYTHEGDDIVIQWGLGGDQTKIPVNYFLGEKVVPNT